MSGLLLDTHALLWWLAEDPRLSPDVQADVADPATRVVVSVASLWEIAIKRGLGRLDVPDSLPRDVTAEGFETLTIDPGHAWAAGALPPHHRDPFDRLLVAQSRAEGLAIASRDAVLDAYGVARRW